MSRDVDPAHLHPVFRQRVAELQADLAKAKLPFRLFEGFRSPQRQRELYAQGRTKPGNKVTNAPPWRSYHQYGVAADFVLYRNGRWDWSVAGKDRKLWDALHVSARKLGLEPLSWELPHLQLAGLSIDALYRGHYPADGDADWSAHLQAAIESWVGDPPSPPLPEGSILRPPIPAEFAGPGSVAGSASTALRVIARNGLRLRSGPGQSHDIIGSLSQGQVVHALAISGDWALVDLQGDGLADGHCHRDFLVPA